MSKLTPDGCCASFLWADDSIHVLYYDRRNPDATGTWLVNVETGEELLLLPLYGYFSPDRSMVAVPEPDSRQVRFRELTTDEEWVVPNLPSRIVFGPRGERIAFTLRPAERPLARGAVGRSPQGVARILGPIAIWIADVRGTAANAIATLPGARIHGWLPDGSALLVTWRTVGKLETSLGLLDLETGEVALLATAPRLLSGRLSPDGEWVAYVAAFTGDLQRDGLWVRRVHGDEARRLIIWGDYRWAPDSASLIVLPPRPKGTDRDRFWSVYVDGEFPAPLTDPPRPPLPPTTVGSCHRRQAYRLHIRRRLQPLAPPTPALVPRDPVPRNPALRLIEPPRGAVNIFDPAATCLSSSGPTPPRPALCHHLQQQLGAVHRRQACRLHLRRRPQPLAPPAIQP